MKFQISALLLAVAVSAQRAQPQQNLPTCQCTELDKCLEQSSREQTENRVKCRSNCAESLGLKSSAKALQCFIARDERRDEVHKLIKDCVEDQMGRPCEGDRKKRQTFGRFNRGGEQGQQQQGPPPPPEGGPGAFIGIILPNRLQQFEQCYMQCLIEAAGIPQGPPPGFGPPGQGPPPPFGQIPQHHQQAGAQQFTGQFPQQGQNAPQFVWPSHEGRRRKRSAPLDEVGCALDQSCALSLPKDPAQTFQTFQSCQQDLNLSFEEDMKDFCKCLKDEDDEVQCNIHIPDALLQGQNPFAPPPAK